MKKNKPKKNMIKILSIGVMFLFMSVSFVIATDHDTVYDTEELYLLYIERTLLAINQDPLNYSIEYLGQSEQGEPIVSIVLHDTGDVILDCCPKSYFCFESFSPECLETTVFDPCPCSCEKIDCQEDDIFDVDLEDKEYPPPKSAEWLGSEDCPQEKNSVFPKICFN